MSDYPKFKSDNGGAYVTLSRHGIVETKDVGYGVLIDIDAHGNVVGVEILWAAS